MIDKPTPPKRNINCSFARVNLINFPVLILVTILTGLSVNGSIYFIQPSEQKTVDLRASPLSDFTHPLPELNQNTGFVKGRLVKLKTNSPVRFADIFCNDNNSFTKSNPRGEFLLSRLKFPVTLKIRKFGFKEETIILNHPDDYVLISLAPLEIHKNNSGNKKPLQYGLILKKALEKFRTNNNSEFSDHSQRELVYCRIISSVDSTVNSLFESYSHMNVNKYALQDYQPDIYRYASSNENIPGLSENRLEFKIDPFISLPIFIEGYITRRGFFEQNGRQIALVGVDLGETKNIYYIKVADTSIVYINSQSKSKRKEKIPGPLVAWQADRSSSTEISFSPDIKNVNSYLIDYISENEDFRVIQKNKPDQTVSKITFFAIVPDSSLINNAVKEYVLHETLTEARQQINFNAKYSLSGKSTVFNSEVEKLLSKPYNHDFWVQNSYVRPDSTEQKQIQSWENDNRFYSENNNSGAIEIPGVNLLVKNLNNNIINVEKVYLETDRPDYLPGDTIWFSAFVLDNLNVDSTSISKILYADLINADNKLERHLKLLIKNGRTHGDFTLNKDLKNGVFRIRAYTQWMENFQSEYLFEKDIPVHNPNLNNLVTVAPVINKGAEGDTVRLYLRTILPVEYKDQENQLEVFVRLNDTLSVKKIFNFKNDLNGSMGFFVPSSLSCPVANIRLTLSDTAIISEQRLSIQLQPGINLQFFPESGKMVSGIETVIAYKAFDNQGNPAEFEADIVDENQNKITHLTGNKSGVGKFTFTPRPNSTYRALVSLSGNKYVFNLPVNEPRGYIMNLNSDSGEILIKNNQNNSRSRHYLLSSVRGAIYTSVEEKLDNRTLRIHLPFETYPKGIVQITLFDSLFRPLAERLVFNNRHDQKMVVHIEPDKSEYKQREKVNLTISVTDTAGNPVESSLAMAVVDAAKTDSLKYSPDIESYLFLASELKGEIDCRLINLADTTLSGKRNIDLVMMTQGWRNFLWNSIRYTSTLKDLYPIEKGFYISGTLLNQNGLKPISDYKLFFFDFKTGFNRIVKVDENSRFNINIPLFYDYHTFFIQNRNKKNRIDDLGFILDTVPVPAITYRNNVLPFIPHKPQYIKPPEEKPAVNETDNEPKIKIHKLPEVIVKARRNRFYFKPDVTINLDKKDPTGKKYYSLFQMIYAEFGEKAFSATGFATHGKAYNPILVVNGAPLTADECPPCYDFNAYQWAAAIPVNEISDVKFYEAGSKYSQMLTPHPPLPTPKELYSQIYISVVSIKTYSNSYRGNPRGTVIFPYQGIYQAREFYQPDYENNDNKITDNRTTIYWNPEVKTDSTGKVRISFYNSDLKGEALIRITGVSYYLKDAATATSHYLSH